MELLQTKPRGLFATLSTERRLRNYSPKTIKAYKSCIRTLTTYAAPKHPRDLTNNELRQFFIHLVEEKKLSTGTISQTINALRFLYVELYKKPFALNGLRRPRKERKLPVFFQKQKCVLYSKHWETSSTAL
ncbi:MAG: phage integrase N-terminal SAM-like domain-containing protein [Bacteroidota bacterium]|nr:phage integrase N-terminal SAM-like domain-containing protein [Bacteroidota bacterium]